jgi:hypothetical protein
MKIGSDSNYKETEISLLLLLLLIFTKYPTPSPLLLFTSENTSGKRMKLFNNIGTISTTLIVVFNRLLS